MDPLAGSRGVNYAPSGDTDGGGPAERPFPQVPQLNLTGETMSLYSGEAVVPYFTPRGSYQTPREKLSEEDLKNILEKSPADCAFSGRIFSEKVLSTLSKLLKSPDCTTSHLRLINCGFQGEAFGALCEAVAESPSLHTLHFEGSACRADMGTSLKHLLAAGSSLRTLNFVNVSIPADSFSEIVSGILSQNAHGRGLQSLCFEGCRLNDRYTHPLHALIVESGHLESLILQGNQLGSAGKGENRSSKAIRAISEALLTNGRLYNLVLASNGISAEECILLAEALKVNKRVLINLTGNSLESRVAQNDRLITKGSSPRSATCMSEPPAASPMPRNRTPRLRETPRGTAASRISMVYQKKREGSSVSE